MTSEWADVFDQVSACGGNAVEAIRRAWERGVSAEQVLEGVTRALASTPDNRAFEDWEALAPGCLDTRVFTQGTWWVDVLRVPHRIASMSDRYVANVIGFLRNDAEHFYETYLFGHPMPFAESPQAWLESTVLMKALRSRQDAS
ncbi:hypothetical protein [Nocardioides jejuensis]|uniref:Uncharacterized protein n=1 Tax=Nocardioides jejuensis TaxID=2502782 RepID=A0A4R1BUP5_9ACTN|nr:hypothetical protein [Nocardioides jejuensis]TCJ21650.1 hypothetical protein EPD65_14580 [Nocardioides jejuensis]